MVHPTKQPEDIKTIQTALTLIENERGKLLARQSEHADKRRALAFDAHAGDERASKLFERLQHEALKIEAQIDGLNEALAEGQRRLISAQDREQQQRNAAKADALLKVLARFTKAGREVEQALTALVNSSRAMRTALNELHAGGVVNPRHEVVDALGFRALSTRLRETIWGNHFRPLGHDDRRDFGDLITSWSATIERTITAQLGERTDEAA